MKKSTPTYPVLHVNSWKAYRDLVDGKEFQSWGFRGQADAEWGLFSSLSRYLLQSHIHRDAWSGQEARILRIFRAKAHLYLDHVPPMDDSYQWLALMQHHGAPTRLLDLTWSPYVALFFALQRATKPAAVWAFSEPAISDRITQIIRGGQTINPHDMGIWHPGNYEKFFLPGTIPFVVIGKPHVMNRRLIAQSGTFIVPGKLDEPIEAILRDYPDPTQTIAKLVIDTPTIRREAMRGLYSMNINNATLFPDLDGLARSLAYELEYHWGFDVESMQPFKGFPDPKDLLTWSTELGRTQTCPTPKRD